jgi:SOS-response transcriptional repressor LexA
LNNEKKMKSSLAKNLETLMQERQISQTRLSKISGVSQSYIFKILNDQIKKPSLDTLEKLATALDSTVAQLNHSLELPKEADPVVGLRKVPLISWVQAGLPTLVASLDDMDKWYICPVRISKNGFALKVRGESMEPMFFEGDIVFIDPEVPAESGRIVAAVDDGAADPEATLKKLVKDGSDYYLKALNPDWPGPKFQPLTQSMRIAGVAVGKYVEL